MSATAMRQAVRDTRPRLLSLRSPHFWFTQALVLTTVAGIYLTDLALIGNTDPDADRFLAGLHVAAVAFTFIPVLYAALVFGLEGAILTTLWVIVLASPTLMPGSPSGDLNGLVAPSIFISVLAIGTILALRVEAERGARQRAEALTRRLALLHEVMQVIAGHRPLPGLLQQLAETIRHGMDADYAAIHYAPAEEPAIHAESGDPAVAARASGPPAVRPWGTGTEPEGETCTVSLAAEHTVFGALSVVRAARSFSTEERRVLEIVGLEASAAFEVRLLEDHRQEALRMYARQVTNAQEAERARIARDLHDGPLQMVASLVRIADLIEKERSTDGATFSTALERLRSVSEVALAELRTVTRDLRPMTLHRLGLHAALRSLAANMSERSGIDVQVRFDEDTALPEEIELCVFRIVQEALSNVEKHAHATEVGLAIAHAPGELRVEVRDNGRGMDLSGDLSDLAHGGRFGVLGMRERAALVDGTLELTSPVPAQGAGTLIRLRIPYTSSDLAGWGDHRSAG